MQTFASATGQFCNPYAEDLVKLRAEFDEKRHRAEARENFIPVYQAFAYISRRPATCQGDVRVRQIKKCLDSFKWERSRDQIQLHEDFLQLNLQLIYGERDFEANRLRLMKEFGLTSFKVGALALFPRRWGKTVAVSFWVAVLLYVCDGIVIATFSPGQRASTSLMNRCVEFFYQISPQAQLRKCSKNEEEFAVAVPDMVQENGSLKYSKKNILESGRVNRLLAFPASSNGNNLLCCFGLCVSFHSPYVTHCSTLYVLPSHCRCPTFFPSAAARQLGKTYRADTQCGF